MKTLMTAAAMAMTAAAAHAAPVEIDSRTLVQGNVGAKLVRYNDPAAPCPDYGTITIADKDGRTLNRRDICGADNILGALQGEDNVIYVYARDGQGRLDMYRYVPSRDAWNLASFKANELKVKSLGTEIMVQAYYPPVAGEMRPQRQGYTWHLRFDEPKKI